VVYVHSLCLLVFLNDYHSTQRCIFRCIDVGSLFQKFGRLFFVVCCELSLLLTTLDEFGCQVERLAPALVELVPGGLGVWFFEEPFLYQCSIGCTMTGVGRVAFPADAGQSETQRYAEMWLESIGHCRLIHHARDVATRSRK
jgi:hypothetical protein